MNDIEAVSKDGNTKIVLEWIGEGRCGDYDSSDPHDCPLIRFTVYRRARFAEPPDPVPPWEQVNDASYCTQISAKTPAEQLKPIAEMILHQVEGLDNMKNRCEELSWIDEDCLNSHLNLDAQPVANSDTGADDLDDGEDGDFSTTCPYCKGRECLSVVHLEATTRIPLYSDGFATSDAEFFDTNNEIVHCSKCDKEFPLSEVTR